MRKTGILGGTFDPIHNGHLAIAEEAIKKLNLDKVIFIPARHQPLKEREVIAPAEHRLAMLELAIRGNPEFELSTVEIERPSPSYTVDTLSIIEKKLGPGAQLYFIIGWDNLVEIPEWKEPSSIIKLCQLVAVPRSTMAPPDLRVLDSVIPGIARRTILVQMAPINISSTDIRDRVAQGLSIHGLVPAEVEKYIQANGLYK